MYGDSGRCAEMWGDVWGYVRCMGIWEVYGDMGGGGNVGDVWGFGEVCGNVG